MPETIGSSIDLKKYFIWVLAPHLETADENINYYYDFSQSIKEYTSIFNELDIEWKWQPVTINNFSTVIDSITNEHTTKTPLIINLCDGDEINGTPGISVIKKLSSKNLIYTGSEEYFYNITTSKIPMKKAFDVAGVSTAKWEIISSSESNTKYVFEKLSSPIILKPSVSGGSMGVGIKNVVDDEASLNEQLNNMFKGYRGWDLAIDGIIAEEFIAGREFTTLITGSSQFESSCKVYNPVERVFHSSLPANEKFLSFDRLWEIYEDETPMPGNENFYNYAAVDNQLSKEIRDISMKAYRALEGTGYGRIDIRMNELTGKLYVLEVNAQCGLSEDENYTSIGAILRVNKTSFKEMILEIILDAINRKEKK
ncbi:MAG: hypothetical protein ACK5AO_06405 [bacterium]